MSELPQAMVDRIQTLNLNVTAQAGTSLNAQRGPTINPTATLPSLALLSPLLPKPYSCTGKSVLGKFPTGWSSAAGCPVPIVNPPPAEKNVFFLAWPTNSWATPLLRPA